jgi:hypothetical protein
VFDMGFMFSGATAFAGDLSGWCVPSTPPSFCNRCIGPSVVGNCKSAMSGASQSTVASASFAAAASLFSLLATGC